jgi:hypothetical protein
VTGGRSVISRKRNDKTVLPTREATKDKDQVYNTPRTLIAIGTNSGKILVFNLLGLLVHEFATDVPVIGIEWVVGMPGHLVLPDGSSDATTSTNPPLVSKFSIKETPRK